jgi:hypothetical protein
MTNHPKEKLLVAGLLPILNPNTPFEGVDPVAQRLGEPLIKFYLANPPQGTTFVCWPPLNYFFFREFQMGLLCGIPPGANI